MYGWSNLHSKTNGRYDKSSINGFSGGKTTKSACAYIVDKLNGNNILQPDNVDDIMIRALNTMEPIHYDTICFAFLDKCILNKHVINQELSTESMELLVGVCNEVENIYNNKNDGNNVVAEGNNVVADGDNVVDDGNTARQPPQYNNGQYQDHQENNGQYQDHQYNNVQYQNNQGSNAQYFGNYAKQPMHSSNQSVPNSNFHRNQDFNAKK